VLSHDSDLLCVCGLRKIPCKSVTAKKAGAGTSQNLSDFRDILLEDQMQPRRVALIGNTPDGMREQV
jgi:hypothetical protein